MSNIPKVAVLLATYNGDGFIAEQIRTILWQGGVSVSIFVRDDGSKDNTPDLLLELAACYPTQLTIINDCNGSSGSAANNFFLLFQSITIDEYDYVALADQDDIWLPYKLKSAIECISANDGGGYSSDLIAWDPRKTEGRPLIKGANQKSLDYLFQGASAGCTYVLDRSAALTVSDRLSQLTVPYFPEMSHDWAIYAICRSAGHKWFHDERAYILYRQHQSNVYGAMMGLSGLRARMRIIKSGWYRGHILWLAHLIDNHAEERAVLNALKNNSVLDRLRLALRTSAYRRSVKGVWLLRLALTFGFVK